MWNDGKEEATDQVVNLALVRSLVDPSTREEGTRGRKEEEGGEGENWERRNFGSDVILGEKILRIRYCVEKLEGGVNIWKLKVIK